MAAAGASSLSLLGTGPGRLRWMTSTFVVTIFGDPSFAAGELLGCLGGQTAEADADDAVFLGAVTDD
jgi:hypothetical protein